MQIIWFCVVSWMKTIVGRSVEVCRRRGQKVKAGKSKVILLGEEEGIRMLGLRRRDTFRACL